MSELDMKKNLQEAVEHMNFTVLKDNIEEVDRKLSVLLENMEYKDYVKFIRSNKLLKNFDDILGLFQNNLIYSESMVNSLPDEFIVQVDQVVLNKIIELGLESEIK